MWLAHPHALGWAKPGVVSGIAAHLLTFSLPKKDKIDRN